MVETSASNPATILVVDDEPQIRRVMRAALCAQGYAVLEASDRQQPLTAFWSDDPDLVLLDVNMPVIDGFEVCRRMCCTSRVPIIVLTVRGSEADKVQAVEAGADDYVVKPFGIQEILARIRSILCRSSNNGDEAIVSSKDLSIDFDKRVVTVRGEQIHLTPKEFELLRELVVNYGRPVSYRRLLQSVWGLEHGDDIESLRVIVAQLQRKIELDRAQPKYMHTEH